MYEGLNHHAIQDAIQKSALNRNQIQQTAQAVRCKTFNVAKSTVRPLTERVFHPVQVMKNVRCAEKLQQAKAGMASQMDERDGGPTECDFDNNDADLRERCIRE